MDRALDLAGRCLLAALFAAGAAQKLADPAQVQGLLAGMGWPEALVWPAALLNALGAAALVAGWQLRWVALGLAAYCGVTSVFHFLPGDGWQMSIFVKNWAITGGLLCLAARAGPEPG
jgi:putative oxidoreductase